MKFSRWIIMNGRILSRENVIENLPEVRLDDKDFRKSVTYIKFQKNLLQTETNNKKPPVRNFQNEFNRLQNNLQLACIDFVHISAIFLNNNNNLLITHDYIQHNKFNKLLIKYKTKQDTEMLIFNFF